MSNLLIDVTAGDVERLWKRIAREKARQAIRTGRLTRTQCTWHDCYERKTEAHHPDYLLPLSVIWLCNNHHRQHHVRLRKVPRLRAFEEMFGLVESE